MTTEPGRYLAYMLRLWQVVGEEKTTWRASLESPHTGKRHGFASLGALFQFLEEQTRSEPSQGMETPTARSPSA